MSDSTPASGTAELAAVPQVAGGLARRRPFRRLWRDPAGVAGAVLTLSFALVALLAPFLAPADPFAVDGPSLAPPSGRHLMGTDALGRDTFSGVIHGTRTSFVVAASVGTLVLVIGVVVGSVAGWFGGRIDDALMRVTEFFQVLPRFFLALVVIAMFGPGLDRLILVLGLTSWALFARVVRAETLSLREREFVEAARATGAGGARIVVQEILPNALPAGAVYLGLVVAQVLLIEASLGFLGLGDPDVISWGYLASQGQRFLRVAWWLAVFPGLAIVLAVMGLNLLADACTGPPGERG